MKKLLLLIAALLFAQNVELNAMKQLVSVQGNRADIKSVEEFQNLLRVNGSVVLLVSTTWCGPCKKLKPIVEELTKEMPNVMFVHIDGDNKALATLVQKYAPEGFPTTKLFKRGQEVGEVGGAVAKEELRGTIQQKLGQGTAPSKADTSKAVAINKPAMITKMPATTKPATQVIKPTLKAPIKTPAVAYQKPAKSHYYASEEEGLSVGDGYSSGTNVYSSEDESSSGYSSSEE